MDDKDKFTDDENARTDINDAVIFEPDEDENSAPEVKDDAPSDDAKSDASAKDEEPESEQDSHGLQNSDSSDDDGDKAADAPLPEDDVAPDDAQAQGEDADKEDSPESIVLDEKPQEQPAEAPAKLTPKHKEFSPRKKKRIAIACVAAVLIIGIVLGISLPIYFANKDKIFVKSAEDFLNYDDGTYFVLDADLTVDGDLMIGRGYNLDLNGHTLIVNGTLTFDNPGMSDMHVGTLDGDKWIAEGNIDADAIAIASTLGTFRLGAPTTAGTISTVAPAGKIFFDSSIVCNGPMEISASEVTIGGNISFGQGDSAAATFTDVPSLTINASIMSAVEDLPARVYLQNSVAYINASGAVDSLNLSHDSKAVVFGKINTATSFGTAAEGDEGSTLVLLDTYSCGSVVNVDTVAIERKDGVDVNVTFTDVAEPSMIFIERLQTPPDININPGTGELVAAVAEVTGAVGYQFSVDGGDWLSAENGSNQYDITELLRSQTGSHLISARAVGNYSYEAPFDLQAAQDGVLYMTSDSISCEYLYQITLSTPTGLSVSGNTLTFANVSFADYYTVTVNGVDTGRHDAAEGDVMTVDLTDRLSAGTNSIRVVAHSDNPDILSSDEAMTSTVVHVKLATPTATATFDSATNLTTVTIAPLEGAGTFRVQYTLRSTTGESSTVTLFTTSTTFNIRGLAIGDSLTIVAEKNGAYTESDAATVSVTAAPAVTE